MNITEIYTQLGLKQAQLKGGSREVISPIDGKIIATVRDNTAEEIDQIITNSVNAFQQWKTVPPPRRGELIRIFANTLRLHKASLGALITVECGKILQEGQGEVQEMIDICDFAVGLSRQLYGLTIASERPGHRMMETWYPIGPVAIISAFNFPAAVWCWNMALAVVCGNSVIWKPSEKTPVTALACQKLFSEAMQEAGNIPDDLSQVIIGNADAGSQLVADKRVPVISATGSTAMGRKVAPLIAQRFGRVILELGGNNAVIVCPSADLQLAMHAIVFGAVGTAGQRCTTTRRLLVHDEIYEDLISSLKQVWKRIKIGNPLDSDTLMGPLINEDAFRKMQSALNGAIAKGGIVLGGQRILIDQYLNAFYVTPALVEMPSLTENIREETFAPILYVYRYHDLQQAITAHNDVPQGLSSAIFTNDLREAELFLSVTGSDCGIANVNIGTSGAEIGGAFGGEKETGGGRESGSDAWKGYMRRMTSTINYSTELPLAQGIEFKI